MLWMRPRHKYPNRFNMTDNTTTRIHFLNMCGTQILLRPHTSIAVISPTYAISTCLASEFLNMYMQVPDWLRKKIVNTSATAFTFEDGSSIKFIEHTHRIRGLSLTMAGIYTSLTSPQTIEYIETIVACKVDGWRNLWKFE